MPEGDSKVVLSMLNSLANVATADAGTLDDVPIRNNSKELISKFFSSSLDNNVQLADDSGKLMQAQTSEEDEFDEIDDSELLQCPDPTSINHVQQTDLRTPFPPRNYQTQNHQPFNGNVDFTPMAPNRLVEQPGYNATTPSIFPESFSRQNHFSQHHHAEGNRYGYASTNQNYDMYPPGSRGGGYQDFSHHGANNNIMHGYQDRNEDHNGYGGYSYAQFM